MFFNFPGVVELLLKTDEGKRQDVTLTACRDPYCLPWQVGEVFAAPALVIGARVRARGSGADEQA